MISKNEISSLLAEIGDALNEAFDENAELESELEKETNLSDSILLENSDLEDEIRAANKKIELLELALSEAKIQITDSLKLKQID